MTSKNLFSKNGLLWESCRRHTWIPVFSIAGFLLASLLPIIMLIQQFYERNPNISESDYKWAFSQTQGQLSQILSTGNFFPAAGLVIMAIIGGLGVFFYLHSRSETDFYHSLPITRSQLFVVNYLTTPVIVIPVYILCSILACVVTAAAGFSGAISVPLIAFSILTNCLFFLLIYSFAVLAAILCGNRIISVLLLIWIDFSLSALLYLLHTMAGAYLKTYASPANLDTFVLNTSPILSFVHVLSNGTAIMDGRLTAPQFMHGSLPTLGVCAAVFLAVTLLCWALFRIRSSESAGNALAFSKCQFPIKVYMVLVVALAGGMLFQAISNTDSILWFVIGILIGGFLMHCVAEGIYTLDIRSIFHHIPQMVLCLAIPLVILIGFANDIAGYDTKTVKLDQITSVSYTDSDYNYENSYYDMEYPNKPDDTLLTDRASIESVWNIANLCVKNLNTSDDATWGGDGYLNCTITFHLKGGRTMRRNYRVSNTQAVQMSQELTYSDAYSEKYAPMKTINLGSDPEDYYISVHSTAYQNQDEANSLALTQKDQIQTLLDTIWTDYRSVGLEYLQTHTPIAYLDSSYGSNIGIYPAYTKTLALLKEQGFTPVQPAASGINSITIRYSTDKNSDTYNVSSAQNAATDDADDSVFAVVTDPNDIAALMQNALIGDAMGAAYPLKDPVKSIQNNDTSLIAKSKTGYSFQLIYLAKDEPTSILLKYRALAKPESDIDNFDEYTVG